MPIGLAQRYRSGAARRVARPWLASLNVAFLTVSIILFAGGVALTRLWAPDAVLYSAAGFGSGAVLGMLGLALTKWEPSSGRLYYQPNRLLVLSLTLLVTVRLLYGLWRLWQGWRTGGDDRSWLIQSGVSGSLAAGALLLGYSFVYWMGLARRARAFQQEH